MTYAPIIAVTLLWVLTLVFAVRRLARASRRDRTWHAAMRTLQGFQPAGVVVPAQRVPESALERQVS